jgi:two-component system CheB/CheR fusion protein
MTNTNVPGVPRSPQPILAPSPASAPSGTEEALERERSDANDLRNVLNSADLATLFLDTDLNIRFFTQAARKLFSVIPGDIGRPLADLQPLAEDFDLLVDAAAVLLNGGQVEREIRTAAGAFYLRRVLQCLTSAGSVAGVVITFADVTDRRRAGDAIEAARREADMANMAKTRFLAAASHDLRQPLQTLALLQGLLAKMVQGTKQQELVARMDDTLVAMSATLDTLLDINQIEAGVVLALKTDFGVNDLLERMHDEFTYHAVAQHISLSTVATSVVVHSDRHRLEQMIRNLCSNALKYTRSGKVLLGCRRRGDMLSIEVWDTGVGIASDELGSIFEEYYQLAGSGRERSRGFGLGLSIVKRLGDLLGHKLRVSSRPGKGSVFAIEVPIVAVYGGRDEHARVQIAEAVSATPRAGSILVVEDDPDIITLLEMLVRDEGHRTASAADGPGALALIESGRFKPDLLLADLNLPNGIDGLALAIRIRERLGRAIPVIILTGDISTDTMRDIASANCVQVHKPASLAELTKTIHRELSVMEVSGEASAPMPRATPDGAGEATIFVVDDDAQLRDAISLIFAAEGREVHTFSTAEEFLAANIEQPEGCLLVDAHMPGMSGLELLAALRADDHGLAAIMMTGTAMSPRQSPP